MSQPLSQWSETRLYRALKKSLLNTNLDLKIRRLKMEAAYIKINDRHRPHKIALDPHQIGLIEGTIHELLHFVLEPYLAVHFGRTLEERIVVDFTRLFHERVLASVEETEWWRAAIDRKLRAS